MNFPRASGVLLHPTSLPSRFGVGDLGDEAYKFVDFLASARQTYWQILPLCPTGYGDSPYQCFSAFAGNTNLISPEKIVEAGFLSVDEINKKPDFPIGRVDFGKLYDWKNWILDLAHERFRLTTSGDLREKFEAFCRREAAWLEDYALFRAIKKSRDGKSWQNWDNSLKLREENALNKARENLRSDVEAQKFQQWLFFRQWSELKNYCHSKNIKIVGDAPIFVALDSADVWRNQSQFKLNEDGSPRVVAGVPPDYFSRTGQLWGNPIYDWERMRQDDFRWWIDRVKATLKTMYIVRVDHFRGFAAVWEVPGTDKTAQNGRWVNVPGRELFDALKNAVGDLPFWAEDLGVITPDVEQLRDWFGFPGMRILQYAFGGDANSRDLPHNYIKNSVAYTGTHDNDTTVGWFDSKAGSGSTRDDSQIERERRFCLNYLKSDGREIHWDFIRAVWESVADTAIVPMQDLLGLGNEARMNLPASGSGNWYWQCREGDFSDEISKRLRELTELYGRI
ncbi:MAG: 4-alpha-glucanotransferase [Acidobacteriota bacterium]|nr:4-alpha-glucanotransferase [Acidobacteriota bacterium]